MIPVNKQAAMVIAPASGWWNKDEARDPLLYLSALPQVLECPKVSPSRYDGLRNGSMVVVGEILPSEKTRLGWRCGHGRKLVARCDCGRFEPRSRGEMRKPYREYGQACTFCKNAYAERVKAEYRKTGVVPPGGLPSHRASQVGA